jgi:predicted TIM-barrel fold metal-dependent hydrolase
MVESAGAMYDLLDRTKVVDVDAHVTEPPDLWTSRLPKKWGDAIPHVRADSETGTEYWFIENTRCWLVGGTAAAAGWKDFSPPGPPRFQDVHPAAYDPASRLGWMDEHGIYAQVLYPNILGFQPLRFMELDPELRLQCVQAYNDFLVEFSSTDPNRLLPMANLPWWDLDESIAELQRCHEIGHKGLTFGWQFEKLGAPPLRSDYWEPLLRTVEDMGWSVNFHIGFNDQQAQESTKAAFNITDDDSPADQAEEPEAAQPAGDFLPQLAWGVSMVAGNQACIAELIFGGICERYPNLKFVSVESGSGYLPYFVESMDWHFMNTAAHLEQPDWLLPSEYFRRQIYGTFWFESHLSEAAKMFPDNLMFETDFPHMTSLAPGPNSHALSPRDTIAQNLLGIDDELVIKMLEGNANRVYGLS